MIRNHEQFFHPTSDLIISNSDEKNLTQVSYNLCIGKIIDSKGKEYSEFNLEPQGIINVISREFLEIPDNTVAYATVKNGMSRKGILAINIGLIDPGYKGMVASHIINFGRDEITIKEGDQFLRLTFHEFDIPNENKSLSKMNLFQYNEKSYLQQRKEETRAYLGKRFLSMDKTLEQVKKDVTSELLNGFLKWTAGIGLLIAGISFGITQFTDFKDSKYSSEIRKIDDRLRVLESSNLSGETLENKNLKDSTNAD